ncbi:efflux RND transporter periplasmic adaptor subunit [Magnetococcus sp. PR-3]|uniref:efflux RND transporter periplasmic adaptor subunit n=1 Tax=Magnetococcus sp. PR-3 TaxID=3120355 RepID=UPI002FCE60EB
MNEPSATLPTQTMPQPALSLNALRLFEGQAQPFWQRFLEAVHRLHSPPFVIILQKKEEEETWSPLILHPKEAAPQLPTQLPAILALTEQIETEQEGAVLQHPTEQGILQGLNLARQENTPHLVMVLGPMAEETLHSASLALLADIPAHYQRSRQLSRARKDITRFGTLLDLQILLHEQEGFTHSAITLCNELASRLEVDRVGLGWITGNMVKLRAISHMERFDQKRQSVQSLEAAMEEVLDLGEETLYPLASEQARPLPAHQNYVQSQQAGHLVGIPLDFRKQLLGVLMLERRERPFEEHEVWTLRLIADHITPLLEQRSQQDRWFGAKLGTGLLRMASWVLGRKQIKIKLAMLTMVMLIAGLFTPWTYRIEAPFILKSQQVWVLPAPFDGYIEQAKVELGDEVKKETPLLSLDQREILLEESSIEAEIGRYGREAEKARASRALADMRVALAMQKQAKVKLKQVRTRLYQAILRAPLDGVIVQGELKQKIGAPVRKGEMLVTVAGLEDLYATLDVDERQIHELTGRELNQITGELAFVGRPNLKFPFHIRRINPVAQAKEGKNLFLVEAQLKEQSAPWFRPGMSGIAKIEVEERPLYWVIGHRTLAFMRLMLWI